MKPANQLPIDSRPIDSLEWRLVIKLRPNVAKFSPFILKRDVSHETKIKLITINSLLNAEYDKIVGYSTLLPLRQMKTVNRKISECHFREFITD